MVSLHPWESPPFGLWHLSLLFPVLERLSLLFQISHTYQSPLCSPWRFLGPLCPCGIWSSSMKMPWRRFGLCNMVTLTLAQTLGGAGCELWLPTGWVQERGAVCLHRAPQCWPVTPWAWPPPEVRSPSLGRHPLPPERSQQAPSQGPCPVGVMPSLTLIRCPSFKLPELLTAGSGCGVKPLSLLCPPRPSTPRQACRLGRREKISLYVTAAG